MLSVINFSAFNTKIRLYLKRPVVYSLPAKGTLPINVNATANTTSVEGMAVMHLSIMNKERCWSAAWFCSSIKQQVLFGGGKDPYNAKRLSLSLVNILK